MDIRVSVDEDFTFTVRVDNVFGTLLKSADVNAVVRDIVVTALGKVFSANQMKMVPNTVTAEAIPEFLPIPRKRGRPRLP